MTSTQDEALSEKTSAEKKPVQRRMCTSITNHSNYKKLHFFPYHDGYKTYTKDGKTKQMIEKWVPAKKTMSHIESPIVCELQNGYKINIDPPFQRKLKDAFIPRRPNRQSLEHQKVLQQTFKENLPNAYLLYWEMGSGKTLGILSALFSLSEIPKKISIVCSIIMIDYWVNNLLDFFTRDQTFDVEVMGYSYFENKFLEEFEEKGIRKEMSKRIFIVDEAHHYRNMSTNMVRALYKYSFADKIFLLTGTPLVNSADELKMWATFFKIDSALPSENSASSEYINWIHANLKDRIMYFNPEMSKNMKNGGSYPDVEEKTIKIEMTWMQTLMYFLSEGSPTFLGITIITSKKNNGLSLFKQVANGFKNSRTGQFISPKNEFLIKANSNEEEYPFPHVIFSGNLETGVEDIYKKLKKNGETSSISIITGNTNAIERQEIVDEYNKGKIKNLLISRVGNEGINLLGTGTLFITTRHENEESANQTKARVVRYESHLNSELKKVKIIDLLSIFPTSSPSKEEKDELGEYMSSYFNKKVSGDDVYQELKAKIKSKKETVEEHLNRLNKDKEAILNPVLEAMRTVGKDWWMKQQKNEEYELEKKAKEKEIKEKEKEAKAKEKEMKEKEKEVKAKEREIKEKEKEAKAKEREMKAKEKEKEVKKRSERKKSIKKENLKQKKDGRKHSPKRSPISVR